MSSEYADNNELCGIYIFANSPMITGLTSCWAVVFFPGHISESVQDVWIWAGYLFFSEDGVNNMGSELVTNEVEMTSVSEVSLDKLENMELIDLSYFQGQIYLQQTPEEVSDVFDNQDSDLAIDDGHFYIDISDEDTGTPLPEEKQHSTPANTDADSNSMNSDENSVAYAGVSIVQGQSSFVPENVISPNSQEKLCQAMKSTELPDDMDLFSYVKSMADLIEKELQSFGSPEESIFRPVQWLKPYTDEVLVVLGIGGVKSSSLSGKLLAEIVSTLAVPRPEAVSSINRTMGCVCRWHHLVLTNERNIRSESSISMLVSLVVPEGKGVSSSASVEVASMQCSCSWLKYQPAEVLGLVDIPSRIRFWGIDLVLPSIQIDPLLPVSPMGDNWQEVLSRKHRNSNVNDVSKISKSVFVTNLPNYTSARELWKTCSVYGTVVDVFIPSKKSKAGKRFAFVRFIKVFNIDRLVKNFSTIWIGKFHLIANHVRNLIVRLVLMRKQLTVCIRGLQGATISPSPVMVLDDSCLVERDLSMYAMGKMKDFSAIPNLYSILNDEGFANVKLSYLGEACNDFVSNERIVWVDIEGVPMNAWTRETFSRIGNKWGVTLDLEENADNSFGRKRLCVQTKHATSILETFKVIVKGRVYMVRAKELFTWNPTFLVHEEKEYLLKDDSVHESLNNEFGHHPNDIKLDDDCASDIDGVPETEFGSRASSLSSDIGSKGASHSEDPFGLYKILKKNIGGGNQEPNPSLSHPPGLNAQVMSNSQAKPVESSLGHKSKKEWIKELNIRHKINFLAIQETKMACVSYMDVKFIWGNSNYQYILSDAIGSSGGILCIWEASIFKKDYVTISDNFIAIYVTWASNNAKVLFVSIYAPQQAYLKRVLWEYISVLIGRWNGFSLTWSHPSASKLSKLDRFLVSEGILVLFPSISALCLDQHLSDHRPILLHEVHMDFGPILFFFYHSWFSFEGFDDMVQHTWNSFSLTDYNGMIRFKKKLQGLKIVIQNWVKAKKHRLFGVRCSIKNELSDIDKDLDHGDISDSKLHRRMDLLHQPHDIDILNSKDFIQKSKIKWAVEGDENSKFFHGIINKKRSQLAVRGVFVDGLWVTDPCKVKDAFLEDLEKSVTRDEIRMDVWSCGENRSPSPDGYSFEFFRKYWNIVGIDFCEAVEYFFSKGIFPIGCNASFIALIPKVLDAKFVSDYRPISLIGCIYKVVTKVLSNRLAPIISDLVSDTQSAFVPNKQILDGPFILSVVMSWCKRKKKQAMFFKVDFAKAGTFSNAMASILVNGSPSSEFQFHSGLKQGDPLSPYIFILVMESLHFSFSRVVNECISLNGKSSISHLFYADDTMFVGEWSEDNLKSIVSILKCFFLASGLKINIHKSQVLGVGVLYYLVEQAANSIGCSIMDKCFRYLGVKVGESTSRHKTWSNLIQKLRSQLLKWKVKTISIGGRLTLLKSVLGASPIYNMSIYKVPKGVLKTMESIRNSFFNGADPSNKKITWAAWNKVLAAKKNGGLGVSSFHALNRALLLKWVWRYISQDGSLWYRVIQAIHGPSIESHASQDHWLEGMVLRDSFPRIFSLELDKDVLVASKMREDMVGSFRRNVRDGVERQQFSELLFMLESVSLSSAQDRWCCDLSGDGEFRVKDIRNQVFSILRGGLFGCFAIVLSLMLRLQDDRLSLMILFPYLSFGVLVDVIGCSLGNIG
nr:RNA-directed DNA polymerase, eukaryota [Tanacetum cinerariifolium]